MRRAEAFILILSETCKMMNVDFKIENRTTVVVNNTIFIFCRNEMADRVGRYNTIIFPNELL